jgi:hypothetical protein
MRRLWICDAVLPFTLYTSIKWRLGTLTAPLTTSVFNASRKTVLFTKRKHLGIALSKMCLLGRKSKLYKQQNPHLQSYTEINLGLRNIALGNRIDDQHKNTRTLPVEGSPEAPRYVPNTVIPKDLQIPTLKHEISRYSYHYSKRLSVHPN